MRINVKKITLLALLTACALIFSYVEAVLPPISSAAPGIKAGLANIVTVFLLYRFSLKDAVIVSALRVVISSLLFSNPTVFVYSIAGAFLSITIMYFLKKADIFSVTGVSVAGAISHNIAQITVAAIFLKTVEIGYYMIVLTITGTVAGIIVGVVASLICKRFEKIKF